MLEGPILVAGAGALGCVFGAMLRGAGHDVTMLARRPQADAIARDGVRLTGLLGEHDIRGFTAVADARDLTRRFRLILLTVKSYDTVEIATSLQERLDDPGVLVSIQNGVGNLEILSERFRPERLLGAKIMLGAELVGPGAARVSVFAEPITVGPDPRLVPSGVDEARRDADAVARLLAQSGISARSVADIVPELWTKLLYNVALNPLGALLKTHYGALAEDLGLRRIMSQAIDEAFAVAQRLNVVLPFGSATEYREAFYGRMVPTTFRHRPSMLYDLHNRGRTEIGTLNGKVVELADKLGLDVSMNRTLTDLIRAAERIRQQSGGSK